MHCYLDLIYQTWQPAPKPPLVPMPPQVVEQHHNSITLEWFHPISGNFYNRWNGLHLFEGTDQEKSSAIGASLKWRSTHLTHIWPVSKLFALPVCWFPREVGSVCDKCTEGRVLLQYASNSSSPRPCDPSGHWSPREAEGMIPDIFEDVTLILDSSPWCFFISPWLVPSKHFQYFHTIVKSINQNLLKNRSNLFQNFTTCFYHTQ